jgi:hypothetical protein
MNYAQHFRAMLQAYSLPASLILTGRIMGSHSDTLLPLVAAHTLSFAASPIPPLSKIIPLSGRIAERPIHVDPSSAVSQCRTALAQIDASKRKTSSCAKPPLIGKHEIADVLSIINILTVTRSPVRL